MSLQAKPDEWLFIQKQRIADETLILGMGRYKDRLVSSEFVNCIFDIVNPAALLIGRCRLIDCVFRPRKKVSIAIGDNYWEGCTFQGQWEGTHFGSSSDDIDGPSDWPEIALRGCDFTQVTMHGCCFKRTDIASTKFPSWPCFTVLYPQKNQKDVFLAAGLPSSYIVSYSTNDTGLSAIVYHWPFLVRKMKPPLDLEAVKAAFQKLDFVRL